MENFLGQLALFAFGLIPKGWVPCQGQLLPINQNQPLFSLLGTTFGGDGRVNFALPDLRGRTPIGTGPSFLPLGNKGGEEFHQLTGSEVPAHNHLLMATATAAQSPAPPRITNLLLATSNPAVYAQTAPSISNPLVATTLANFLGNQGHENRTPFLAMNWCIALSGIFPSQN
jgi:microcystin-dependent protein